jgi:hypothetical protein
MWRIVLALSCALFAPPASASDESPWFGGEGQPPFRLSASGTEPDSAANGADKTMSKNEQVCTIESCAASRKLAEAGE